MKNIVFVCIAGGWLCCSACANHSQSPALHLQDSLSNQDSVKNAFFPIADYLETEIMRVDSIPRAMTKYTTRDGKTDSGYIQLSEFNTLALQFLLPEFKDGSFEKNYTESSFMDKTTQSVTFTYSTTDKDLPLQRIDVQADPSGRDNQVKSIYMEKSRVSGDSVILQKMYWEGGRNFQVVSFIRIKGRAPIQQLLKVVWDTSQDNEQ
jgi:hypothetical protein